MIILFFVLAYVMGSIPTGYWIGLLKQVDITKMGSGNTGGTNTFRVLGKKSGLITVIVDVLKGTVPVLIYMASGGFEMYHIEPLFIGVVAILGHTYSVFIQFKGGKAVATTGGVILALYPIVFVWAVVCFLMLVYFTRMVSLSSMLTASVLTIMVWLMYDSLAIKLFFTVITLFIIFRHQENIKRIIKGCENKVPFGFGYKKEDK